MKGPIKNEYRELWRAGITDGIPADVLIILEEQYASEKSSSKEASEESFSKKTRKEVKGGE